MNEELAARIGGVIDRLLHHARRDGELRGNLRELARKLAGELDRMDREEAQHRTPKPDPKLVQAVAGLADRMRDNSLAVETPPAEEEEYRERNTERENGISDGELSLIQERCRLKSSATLWCINRRFDGEEADEEGLESRKRELIERAKALPDCYLWMLYPWTCTRGSREDWHNLAECFENLRLLAVLLQTVLPHREEQRESLEEAVRLAAEVQSALRAASERVGNRVPEPDQEKTFWWLRRTTEQQRIFVSRFMKWNDTAEPGEWEELRGRIARMDEEFHTLLHLDKAASQLLNKARYHVKLIERTPDGPHDHDWRKIIDTVEKCLETGAQPSSVELRDLLLPVINDLPEFEEEHKGFDLVVREIDRYLNNAPVSSSGLMARERSEEVEQAAELLRGRVVVMIGGVPRPDARDALRAAFELEELDWVDSREHQSIEFFRPRVTRPEVALVLLAIRWSSHSFGDVKEFCDSAGKPFVRLPGGYAPNQVARQILSQASGLLGGGED